MINNKFKQTQTPRKWEDLVALKDYLSDCDPKILRLPGDYSFYSLYRELVPRKIALTIIERQIGKNRISLILNNFPYTGILQNLKNVQHYCLWSKEGKLNSSEIKSCVDKFFPQNRWFYSERKIGHKSVPEIWHCHIFVEL
ncbi:MAG: hypothetical protein WC784_03115 [Candidatus Shapirobacteria bacterium]|jgi:hypothetical protein